MCETKTATVHCFEQKGLGKAPFTFVGLEYQEMAYGQRVIGSVGGCAVTTKPGGTCDFCHTYIVDMFRIRSADGKEFKVGCDCVLKTGDAGLIKKIEPLKKAAAKERKRLRDLAIIANGLEVFAANRDLFRDQDHPNAYWMSQGKTLRDYVQWLFDNHQKLRAAKMVLREVK